MADILVADDEPGILAVIKNTLIKDKYLVTTISDSGQHLLDCRRQRMRKSYIKNTGTSGAAERSND